MEIPVLEQLFLFLYSLVLGLVLGGVYDGFRLLRMILGRGKIAVFIQDFIYFTICAVAVFLFIFIFNKGQIRLFIFLSVLIGWLAYYLTLGKILPYINKKIKEKKRKMSKGEQPE